MMKMCLYGVSLITGLIRPAFRPLNGKIPNVVYDIILAFRLDDYMQVFDAPADGKSVLMSVYHARERDSRPLTPNPFLYEVLILSIYNPSQLAGSVQNQRVGRFGMTV